jgi:hypothetical protein
VVFLKEIKVTNYSNAILMIIISFSILLEYFLILVLSKLIEEEKMFVLFFIFLISIFQILTGVFLYYRMSRKRDYLIIENEIIQNSVSIVDRKEIISIKRINLLKVEIKCIKDQQERSLFIVASNKKINDIKALLGIYE